MSKKKYDEESEYQSESYLEWGEIPLSTKIIVPIDEVVKNPSYYRQVASRIQSASQDDIVEFRINSSGGRFDGLCSLLTAIGSSTAQTVAIIEGEAYSAASMLALSCDSVLISPYASMMCHFVSYGASGKGSDIHSKVQFTQKHAIDVFTEVYAGFLTEEEIALCILGHEYWFDADEILKRLENRESLFKEFDIELEDLK